MIQKLPRNGPKMAQKWHKKLSKTDVFLQEYKLQMLQMKSQKSAHVS